MRRGWSAPLVAKVLLVAVLLTTLRAGGVGWHCDIDGVTRSECCGPNNGERVGAHSAQSIVEAPCCCRIERTESDRTPGEIARNKRTVVFEYVPSVSVDARPADVPFPSVAVFRRTYPRLRPGRALLLMKHSLII